MFKAKVLIRLTTGHGNGSEIMPKLEDPYVDVVSARKHAKHLKVMFDAYTKYFAFRWTRGCPRRNSQSPMNAFCPPLRIIQCMESQLFTAEPIQF